MPQPSLHLALCHDLLDAWSDRTGDSPFDSRDAQNRAAFLHGALGPDMGFFPGALLLLARLAHQNPTGEFVRVLAQHAPSERDFAFACGWASHLLLDAVIHPLINARAATLLGLRLEDVALAQLEHTHIRLEIGLDLAVHRRQPQLQRLRLNPVFDNPGLQHLARCYTRVHGVAIPLSALMVAHRRVCQILGPMLTLQSSMAFAGADGAAGDRSPAVWSVRAGLGTLQALARGFKGAASKTVAFLTPVRVDAELLGEIDVAVARFRPLFQSHLEAGLARWPNYNIDTGQIEPASYGESAA
jgi:hypothetical protein